jgi:cytochrome c553
MCKILLRAMAVAAATLISAAASAAADDDIAAKVQVCAGCHGANGEPADPKSTPIIWGQQSNYLYKELHDYHSGARSNQIMEPLAKTMSLPDLRQAADYLAAKPWPAAHASSGGAAPESSGMCRACHGQNFEGGAPAPRLAGLSYEYLVAAMQNFADGTRTNNLDMPGFMRALSESDREAIAHYLAGL